jgi:hypothetical protein
LPSAVRGTFGVGKAGHCADSDIPSAATRTIPMHHERHAVIEASSTY